MSFRAIVIQIPEAKIVFHFSDSLLSSHLWQVLMFFLSTIGHLSKRPDLKAEQTSAGSATKNEQLSSILTYLTFTHTGLNLASIPATLSCSFFLTATSYKYRLHNDAKTVLYGTPGTNFPYEQNKHMLELESGLLLFLW